MCLVARQEMPPFMIWSKKPRRQFLLVSSALFLIFSVSTLWLTTQIMYQRGIKELSESGKIKLELFVTYLQGVLKAYESLPELWLCGGLS
jgi:C4-dicarboxylate-specific signal transduction histidine kinase